MKQLAELRAKVGMLQQPFHVAAKIGEPQHAGTVAEYHAARHINVKVAGIGAFWFKILPTFPQPVQHINQLPQPAVVMPVEAEGDARQVQAVRVLQFLGVGGMT